MAKYKVLSETELFQKLQEFFKLKYEAEDAACKLTEELGAKEFRPSPGGFGGISSICFENNPDPKSWKNSGIARNEFMPKCSSKSGKEIDEKISKLPRLTYRRLTDLISDEKSPFWCPSVIKTESCFLIHVPDNHNSRLNSNDLIEILDSEYFRLKEEHEAKEKSITQD
jgi:hypothetical protein